MLENLKALKIKGGIFEEETELVFFEEKRGVVPNFSLVYGKNGTGKSTISSGFQNLNINDDIQDNVQIETAVLKGKNGEDINLPEKNEIIHVFNEKFIEDNIRINSDGLNSIIVMGAAKELDDKIKSIEPFLKQSRIDYENKLEQLKELENKENEDSPENIQNRIKLKLRGKNGWAERDKNIKGNSNKTPVLNDTYTKINKNTTSKSSFDLGVEFRIKLSRLKEAKNGNLVIEKQVPNSNEQATNKLKIQELEKLLPLKIEKPELNDREKFIIQILGEDKGVNKLIEIKDYFLSSKEKNCPFCFQEVSKDYSNQLVESIENILSKKAEEHRKNLEKVKLEEWNIDFTPYINLPQEIVASCEKSLLEFNSEIHRINALIQKKINNLYEPITEKMKLQECFTKISEALLNLETSRIEYNKNANDIKSMTNELSEINEQIAYLEIEDLLKKLSESEEKIKIIKSECETLKNNNLSLEKQYHDLEEQKKNARIAMERINDDLSYIFFSKDRLKIDFKNNKYILYSRGKPVSPDNVSVGERNALGLSYFFNSLMNNKKEAEIFGHNYLLVIDDPVSSFDMENRIGILSYLKYKLGQYIKGNANSKFIIFTHDLQTFYDLEHLIAEIYSSIHGKSESAVRNKYFKLLELSEKNIKDFNLENKNEYTKLLEIVYDFANCGSSDYLHSIGNIMRKVLEAFGTFVYKKGISQLSTDSEIIASFPESERQYFENFMYRLVLNTDSHLEEKVQTTNDLNFFDFITQEEKQRTAKLILVLLYKLNPLHINAHLKNKDNSEEIIKSWSDDLKEI